MGLRVQGYLLLLCAIPQLLQAAPVTNTFDYVVVGGGTAGLVVAARLSEDPSTTVAVIEAGIYHVNEPLVDTPQFFGRALGNSSFDWNFASVPQPVLNNRVVGQDRGKMLGGTSGLNFMIWDRADSVDYDAWEQLGATGWNFNNLLPYFIKQENVQLPEVEDLFPGAAPVPESTFGQLHGNAGPLQTSYNDWYSDMTDPYVEAMNTLGIPTNSEPYGGNGTGIYNSQMTIDRVTRLGKRSYSATTYYQTNAGRPNLSVFTATQATKVNFKNARSRRLEAISVDVVALDSTGITGTILAAKEVILSAGTFQTPQLLELSGIGNKKILRAAGVDVLIDLPGVGENFQDHTMIITDFQVPNSAQTYDELKNNATFLAEQQAEYAANGTGILSVANSALAFPPTNTIVSADVLASLKCSAANLTNTPGLSNLTKAQYEILSGWLDADDTAPVEFLMIPGGGYALAGAPTPGDSYMTIAAAHMHPFARGTVHINSSHPLVQPVINPNYLDNDVDFQLAVLTTKYIRTITETAPLASSIIAPHDPPASVSTDDEWTEWVKSFMGTIWHPIGTATMLPKEIGGVVDPTSLKVYGTSNLRVVDASLFPLHIAGHPQSVVYATAERASDIIKGVI